MTTTRAAVPIRFYECPVPSFEDTISKCDKPLYDWLVSIDPPLPYWTPQRLEEIRIFAAVQQARVDAQAACEASKFASHPAPQTGVSVSVSTKLPAAPASGGKTQEGLRAQVNVDFSTPIGCGSIPYQVIHSVKAIGGSYHPENTVFETSALPPAKNGTGNFANTIVFDLVNADTAWRNHIHQVFTGGTWRIRSPRVFAQYSEWELAGDPEPGAELVARSEAFDASRLRFEYPDFPGLYGASGPRWLVVHRYSHQQSGRWFYLSEWKTVLNSQNVTWPDAVFGRAHASETTHDDFVAPDDGDPAFFDPDGTWLHQSGVIDFAMTNIAVQTLYASQLCTETARSINPLGAIDPRTAAFLSPQAYFEETVEVRTIRQYKACYRVTGIDIVDSVGIRLRVKLINDFNFSACIVARMPFGDLSKCNGYAAGGVTIVLARNLAANSESNEIAFIVPLRELTTGNVSYKLSDVMYDALNGGGFSQHGFACAHGTYSDRLTITSITSDASALQATSTTKAQAWGYYNPAGARFWSNLGSSDIAGTAEVFNFTPARTSVAGCKQLAIDIQITASVSNNNLDWTRCTYKNVVPYGYKWYVDGVESLNPISLQLTKYGAWLRYGWVITAAAGSARDAGAQTTAFIDWSNGSPAELAAYLIDRFTSALHTWVETRIKLDTGSLYAKAEISGGYSGTPCFMAGRGFAVSEFDFGAPANPAVTEEALYWLNGTPMGPDGFAYGAALAGLAMYVAEGQSNLSPQMVLL